jgi:hypothetical protein
MFGKAPLVEHYPSAISGRFLQGHQFRVDAFILDAICAAVFRPYWVTLRGKAAFLWLWTAILLQQ